MPVRPLLLGAVASVLLAPAAMAQKYPGPVPEAMPRPAPAYRAPEAMPAPGFPPAPAEPQAGSNPAVEQFSRSLPLDPATRELRDRLPADVPGTQRQLGLREPRGPRLDLRGRTPSPREIADALASR